MNAIDPGLTSLLANADDLRKSDIVLINRGGATDVVTSLLNMAWLQDQLPYHLIDYRPVIFAGSAGTYPTFGMVTPSQSDPTRPLFDPRELPEVFERNVGAYLSRNRQDARERLISQAGRDVLLSEVLTPVSISSVDITNHMQLGHFRHFPESYMRDQPDFERPRSLNADQSLADAVLASSAYPAFLGDYTTRKGTRHIDMAFVEGHAADLSKFAIAHHRVPGRDVICIIFGNNYLDFTLNEQDEFKLAHIRRYFPDAIRSFVHESLVQHCQVLFGDQNVYDLSLKIPQDFTKRLSVELPGAFRKDPHAIRTRLNWTRQTLMDNQDHADKIEDLAHAIQTRCAPVAAPVYSFPPAPYAGRPFSLNLDTDLQPPSAGQALAAEFVAKASPAVRLAAEKVEPAVQFTKATLLPFATGMLRALAGSLVKAWDDSAPWRTRQIDKLLPPPPRHRRVEGAEQRLIETEVETLITPPLRRRSSVQRTPSESGHMPL